MAKIKQKITEQEVSLRLNLKEIFGTAVTDSSIIQDFASDLIDVIRNRTLSGFGVWEDGRTRKFTKYSKSYAVSKGVSVGDVDLELSGDMLDAIELLDYTPQTLSIGIIGPEAPKAHGHQTGQKGLGPLPKRPFLNLTEAELNKIAKTYISEVTKQEDRTARRAIDSQRRDEFDFTASDILEAIRALQTGRVGP